MVIFLELECILLDCERLPQIMDTLSQVSTPSRIPSEKMRSLIPFWAAISLECSVEMSFVIVRHSLLMIWATSLGFALLSCREVYFFLVRAFQSLEVSS